MLLTELLGVLDALAPLRHAERWDNVGLLVESVRPQVERALLTIDFTDSVADEAARERCELVVAYHPVIFDGLKRVRAGTPVARALREGLALYCPHTALDVVPGGTSDVLAGALGLTGTRPLRPSAGASTAPADERDWGLGRVGALGGETRLRVIERVKRALGVPNLLVAGPLEGAATRGAVCPGAGRELLGDALRLGAEVFLTGELPHHDALRAAQGGLTVLCALHSNSERQALRGLRDQLEARAPGVRWKVSASDRDPFVVL